MKRLLFVSLALVLFSMGLSAQVTNVNRIIYTVDARTVASNGTGSAAILTLLPIGSYVAITCNDPDGCAITMGESGIPDGMPVTIVNVSTNLVTFADSAGVQELASAVWLGQYESLSVIYRSDRWVEMTRSVGLLRTATVTLTNAQILALPSTAITIVAAPGAGLRLKPIGATIVLNSSSGAYTTSAVYASLNLTCGGKWITLPMINDNTLTTPLAQVTGFLGAAQIRVWDLQMPYVDAVDSGSVAGTGGYVKYINNSGMPTIANLTNEAIKLNGENTGGDFTGGHANNTLKVIVYYIVEAL